jgi:hypothetical protein
VTKGVGPEFKPQYCKETFRINGGGEMTQTLYAHMNKIKIKKKESMDSIFFFFISTSLSWGGYI